MAKVLMTGSSGFIGGYVVDELLRRGHEVVGLDNLSKYGRVIRSYDDHPGYRFVQGDCCEPGLLSELQVEVKDDDLQLKVHLDHEPTEEELEQLNRIMHHAVEEFRRRLRKQLYPG